MQKIIDSGKDDGNLAVVIVHGEDPIEVVQKEEEPELTGPNRAKRDEDHDAEGDLLDQFVKNIEHYFAGWFEYDYEFIRPSATEIEVRIEVSGICDYQEGVEDDEDVRSAFYEVLPDIIEIYQNAGWKEVFFEGDEDIDSTERDGVLVFRGEVSPSPYRKLLEGKTDASDDTKLTSPKEVQA